MNLRIVATAAIALILAPARTTTAQGESLASRIDIVPIVDHHQHVIGPVAVSFIAQSATLAAVALPPELDKLLRAREKASGGNDVSLFTADAQILDISEAEDHWVRGKEGLERMVAAYPPGTPLTPTAYNINGRSGFIAGVIGDNPDAPTMHFMLGLVKDVSGSWRIAVEYATLKPPVEFPAPLTADKTIQVLDDAGIKRSAVLSVAYWLGDGAFKGSLAEEYAKVREENDWMAAQIARFPARLVGFCGVNPLRDYALAEVRRCATLPGIKGMKLHFGNSNVDLTRAEHVETVRRFVREVNGNRMALVAHLWIRDRSYGARHTRIFIDQILPEAPDITVQVAHLGGAGRYAYDMVAAEFASAITARNPHMKNVYFDLATVVTERQSAETIALITKRLREIGIERILFAADTPGGNRPDPVLAWATIRRRLPLTEKELRTIAGNVAPYLH